MIKLDDARRQVEQYIGFYNTKETAQLAILPHTC
jgi:hypothetical protein